MQGRLRPSGRGRESFRHSRTQGDDQDPDVIAVGEMRDLDTIATALTAAETGHLVLATLHTPRRRPNDPADFRRIPGRAAESHHVSAFQLTSGHYRPDPGPQGRRQRANRGLRDLHQYEQRYSRPATQTPL